MAPTDDRDRRHTPGEARAARVRALDPEVHAARAGWFRRYLQALHDRYQALDEGAPASYIPDLAGVDPGLFGIGAVTTDGQRWGVGDHQQLFTIQSISKVLVYGLALEEHGRDHVLDKVGVEPTGEDFNAIVLDEVTNRPPNPMVNAGAIATTDLIQGDSVEERWERILDTYQRYLGHPVTIDEDVFRSELDTGDRNRAIAYLMLSHGMIEDRVEETLELYFRQCSVLVSAGDLALIGATLANAGVNPRTGDQALDARYVRDVLSVALTCGMYNYSGEWVYRVGLPAKSGVGGGVMVLLPGEMGLGVFSPPLDRHGNSVRGMRVCEDLVNDLGVHLFESGRPWLLALPPAPAEDDLAHPF